VARSPDGGRLAVARFTRPPGDPVGGSDVQVTGTEGGAPLLTIARERPGEVLGAPAWLPDGGLIFERGTVAGAAGGIRLERVDADGSGRRPVADQAAMPSVSPDGRLLAFVRSTGGDRLIIRPLDGGPEAPLVDDPSFLALAFPRFSPDGQWIAFSAVTEGAPPAPTNGPGGPGGLSFLLPGARPALAHGLPWDVWLIRPDGSGLRRLTFFYDDDAATAWSADGRWLAIFAVESIKLVPLEGQGFACVLDRGGYGGFEWLQ
jgi:Tol biopolymer transport system component